VKGKLTMLLAGSLAINLGFALTRINAGIRPGSLSLKPLGDVRPGSPALPALKENEGIAKPGSSPALTRPNPGRILLPAADLTRLIDYDYAHLKCDRTFADCFGLTPAQTQSLDQELASWVDEAKRMEAAGLQLVNENGESYYKVSVDAGERDLLFKRITTGVAAIGIHDAETVSSIILAHPRFAALLHDQEIGFNQDENGNLYFDATELNFMLSPASKGILANAEARYGHLFDFTSLREPQ
jgi:hypothetical protein